MCPDHGVGMEAPRWILRPRHLPTRRSARSSARGAAPRCAAALRPLLLTTLLLGLLLLLLGLLHGVHHDLMLEHVLADHAMRVAMLQGLSVNLHVLHVVVQLVRRKVEPLVKELVFGLRVLGEVRAFVLEEQRRDPR